MIVLSNAIWYNIKCRGHLQKMLNRGYKKIMKKEAFNKLFKKIDKEVLLRLTENWWRHLDFVKWWFEDNDDSAPEISKADFVDDIACAMEYDFCGGSSCLESEILIAPTPGETFNEYKERWARHLWDNIISKLFFKNEEE